jgi:hypothetical protein
MTRVSPCSLEGSLSAGENSEKNQDSLWKDDKT